MADYIYENGELHHHGIKGMRWGVRRYQNSNGTLTAAGKKRYDREMEKAKDEARVLRNRQATANKMKKLEDLQTKNRIKKNELDGQDGSHLSLKKGSETKKGTKKKLLSEMSNDEIRAVIERRELENRLRSLAPKKEATMGQKFVEGLGGAAKDVARNLAMDAGKAAINKWLGVDDSAFKQLEKQSKIADFKKKIAESESVQRKNNKEKAADAAAAAEEHAKRKAAADEKARTETYGYTSGFYNNTHKKSTNSRNTQSESYEYTVEGEGRSSSKFARKEKRGNIYEPEIIIDMPVSSVPSTVTNRGRNEVAGLLGTGRLLDDPRNKKK